jgi:transposase
MLRSKNLTQEQIAVIRKLLLKGNTSMNISKKLNISVATVSNYRAYFKKQGDVFPDNRGRKPKNPTLNETASIQIIKSTNQFSDTYKYNINGLQVTFSDKPKNLRIGKKGMVVEF